MAPEILREMFPLKESNCNIRNTATLQEVLKPSCMAGNYIKQLKNILSRTLVKRKFVNGPQRIVYVVQVRTEHWTSVGCLHTRLCFVTCDIQLNDIEMI